MSPRLSLKYRIALVIFVLEVVMMAAVLWRTLSVSLESTITQEAATQEMLLELVSDLGSTALLTGEYADIQIYLEQVESKPTVERVHLVDVNNAVVASTQVTAVGRPLPAIEDTGERYWRTREIGTAAGTLGLLAIEFSNASLMQAYERARNLGIVIAAIGMLVIGIVGVLTGFALTRRLDRIAQAARRFAAGELTVNSGVHGGDELGALGQTIDDMVQQVAHSQEHLHEQSEQIRLLMDSTAEAIYGVDLEGNCIFANPACLRMLGHERDTDLIGRNMHELIHHTRPDGMPCPLDSCQMMLAAQRGESARSDQEIHWRADGTSFPVECWSHPMRRDGELIGAVVTFIDITERRQAEAALEESEIKHYSLFENANDAIYLIDPVTAGILDCNKKAAELDGYSIDELKQMTVMELHPEGERDALPENFRDVLERGSASGISGMHHRRKDGAQVPIEVNATIIEVGGKKINLSIVRDITERRRAEAELERHREHLEELVEERTNELTAVNRELETFAYSVSHDLRAPLRSINGFSQALTEDYAQGLDAQGRDYLARVIEASRRMGELIDDLLTLSRITRSEMHQEAVDLSTLAGEVMAQLREHQPGRRVEAVITPGMAVRADRRLLRVVLENLLGNAWKFTGNCAEARIECGCESIDGEPVYFVRDNGAGFDMAYVDKLFGAFQRLHSVDEFEGTGIGLATVQRVIHRHGGRVWAEGAVNQGATIYFSLP